MKTLAKFVFACAGAPIVALWVGGATAWAAPSTGEDASDATPTQQTNTGGLGISIGDAEPFNIGNATANSSGSSMAVAFNLPGAGPSTATADGDRNFALAINGSTATANGNRNFVFAGDDSEATATGDDNDVRAAFGSTNHVTGDRNTSYAIPASTAQVTGDNNVAVSLCGGSVTISGQGERITSAPCLGVN